MKKIFTRIMPCIFTMILIIPFFTPMNASAASYKKTHTVFDVYGGYAKDTFTWTVTNGKITDAKATQSSQSFLCGLYPVTKKGIALSNKTSTYNEYKSSYNIGVFNKYVKAAGALGLAKVKAFTVLWTMVNNAKQSVTITYRIYTNGTYSVTATKY